jgi:hypothetical protein
MAFANLSPESPKIDLYAAKRLLAGRLMQNTTQGLFFRDGYGLTEDFTQDVMAAQVRILRHRRPTILSRTMSEGVTNVNNGHFNTLDPAQPSTKEYKLDLLEVYDQNVDIADVLEHMIGIGALNLEAQGIEDQLTRLINAYTFAAQIAAALNEDAAAGIAGGVANKYTAASGTLIRLGSSDTLTSKFFEAHSALDNGSAGDDIDTFKHDGRVAVFTPEAKFQLVTSEKTVFEIGSSRAVQLLEIGSAGGLETRPETNVTGYFGHLNSTPLHMVSKPIWALVELYLGLPAGTLADKVLGLVVASEATGRGIAFQNSIKIIDNPRGQGYRLQPLTRWGVEVFIPAGIKLIVKDDFVNPAVDASKTIEVVDPVGIVGFNPAAPL